MQRFPVLQARIPTSPDELVFEVCDQRWLEETSLLYSGDRLAEGPRVRGMLALAGAQWVVIGGWGLGERVREVRAEEVVPRARYDGPIWKRGKYRNEYAAPHDFYVGRLVVWRKKEWVLVRRSLRLVKAETPPKTRQAAQRHRRKPQPAQQQSLLETLLGGGETCFTGS
jgi:hypothetical protein